MFSSIVRSAYAKVTPGIHGQRAHGKRNVAWFAGCALSLIGALGALPAAAQQKTGPGVPSDDSLTWQGITLYGVVDIGLQYDTHSAPFTPYRPSASGSIVRSNDYESPFGVTPSNMGQSRVGIQGTEPLIDGLKAIFQVETFFNPQSGQLADSLRSLAANNGKAVTSQNIGVDGSSAGQAFQTAFIGVESDTYGAATFGRQVTLLSEGMIKYDPNYLATAFGLLGGSNTYAGGGSSEDNRLNDMAKYRWNFKDLFHVAGLYEFNESSGSGQTAVQADVGGAYAGASLDAYYSKINSAITATALTIPQAATLPAGDTLNNSLAATISDNTTYALMGLYQLDPLKFFAGYENIKYANPKTGISAGSLDIGDYVLAYVNNTAYTQEKFVQVYWTGLRYTIVPGLDLTGAYYQVHQSAYGVTRSTAGCVSDLHSTCAGNIQAISFDADYRFNVHFDIYAGAMYSSAHGGLGSGYLYSTDINPTIGARFKF